MISRLLAVLVLTGLVLWSCDDSSQPPHHEKFEGILQTDELCTILGGDSTDFLPRPEPGDVDTTVYPPVYGPPKNNALAYACPNPAEYWSQVHFQLSEPDSVWVFVYDESGAPPVDTLFNQAGKIGWYMVTWTAPRGPGIYRVKMFTAGGFRSYGDVEFTGTPAR